MSTSTPTATAPQGSFLRNVLVLAVPAVLIVAAIGGYLYSSAQSVVEGLDYVRMIGLIEKSVPRSDKLASQFTDADGDLVADAPTDVKAQLDPETLVFAPIPSGDAQKAAEAWTEFAKYLGEMTKKKVEILPLIQSNKQTEGLEAGTLHVTGFNTGAVPFAVNQLGFVPVAAMAKPDGSFTYEMQIIVPADSPIQRESDIKGRILTFTNFRSHSGFKAPLIALREGHSLIPGRDYDFSLSGGHYESIRGIAGKQYHAAAVASDMLRNAEKEGLIGGDKSKYRVIHTSKPFPPAAYGYTHRLKPELAEKVKQAFLTFSWNDTGLLKAFAGANFTKFVPVSYKEQWAFVREIDGAMRAWTHGEN